MNAYLYRTFEYVAPDGDMTHLETRILFSYSPGTCHSHPRGHYNRTFGSWDPPDPATRDYASAERQVAGQWLALTAGEWLETWCRAAFEEADEADLIEALPDLEPL